MKRHYKQTLFFVTLPIITKQRATFRKDISAVAHNDTIITMLYD